MPHVEYSLCKGEWDRYGSCCQVNGARGFVDGEGTKIKAVLERAEDQLEQTQFDMQKYAEVFKQYIENKDGNAEKFKNLAQPGKEAQMNDSLRNHLKTQVQPKLNAFIVWLATYKSAIVGDQKKCLNKLHELRVNSVCYTCSARSTQFFQGDELKLHENVCRALISECSASWSYLIEFLDKVNAINKLIRETEQFTNIRFRDSVEGSPASTILDWADRNNFRALLNNCKDGQCSFDTAKKICDNFVSITSPIYLKSAL